jgi:murein DD-endopeptidase MepM/ murein hydrolase activator NlpD
MKAKNAYILPVPKNAIIKIVAGMSKESPAHIDGRTFNPPFGDERKSVDYYCREGTVIFAAQDGTVVWVKEDSNEGGTDPSYIRKANGVSILHKNGEFTNYLHLKHRSALVKKGQDVKKGQVIGAVGATGWTPAPHLHFCVFRVYGNDPFIDYETMSFDIEEP